MALGLAQLARRWPERGRLLIGVAMAVVVVEFLPGRLPTEPVAVPHPYTEIAAQNDGRAVMDLPLQWPTAAKVVGDRARADSLLLYYPIEHLHPLTTRSLA